MTPVNEVHEERERQRERVRERGRERERGRVCSLQSVDDDNGTKSDGVVATKEVHFRAIDGSFGHK